MCRVSSSSCSSNTDEETGNVVLLRNDQDIEGKWLEVCGGDALMHLFHKWVRLVHAPTGVHFRYCSKCLRWQKLEEIPDLYGTVKEWRDYLAPPADIRLIPYDDWKKLKEQQAREAEVRRRREFWDHLRKAQRKAQQ